MQPHPHSIYIIIDSSKTTTINSSSGPWIFAIDNTSFTRLVTFYKDLDNRRRDRGNMTSFSNFIKKKKISAQRYCVNNGLRAGEENRRKNARRKSVAKCLRVLGYRPIACATEITSVTDYLGSLTGNESFGFSFSNSYLHAWFSRRTMITNGNQMEKKWETTSNKKTYF